jgi:hypothetical protein
MFLYSEGGVGGNMFESKVRTVKYRNVDEIEGGYKPFKPLPSLPWQFSHNLA